MSLSFENEINLVRQSLMGFYQINQAVFTLTLIRLKLPDYLVKQNMQSLAQLAKHFVVDVGLLELLRPIAVELEPVEQDEQHCTLTSKGKRLCPDAPDSLIPGLSVLDDTYAAWGGLQQSLQTGQSAFVQVPGMSFYEYVRPYPEKNHHSLWVMFGVWARTQTDYYDLLTRIGFETLRWVSCPNEDMNLFFLEARPVWQPATIREDT